MSEVINLKLAALLKEKNISQKKLAELTGMTESAISHYVKGDRVPRGVNLLKIAQVLGVTADYLFENGDTEKNNDFKTVKALIARSANTLSTEEKMEIISLLTNKREC